MEYYLNLNLEDLKYFDLEGNECIEYWKNVEGYNSYQISCLGRVKSLERGGKGGHICKILKPIFMNTGYTCYVFRKEKKSKSFLNHRLVGQAFLGLDINNSKILVCHKDDIRHHNNLDNLFLGTHKDNMQDCSKKGRTLRGEISCKSKIKNNQIIELINKYNDGISAMELSKFYGVKVRAIYAILEKKTYKNIISPDVKKIYRSKRFNENDVINMRKMYKKGIIQKDIAKLYNIDGGAISRIVNYKIWK